MAVEFAGALVSVFRWRSCHDVNKCRINSFFFLSAGIISIPNQCRHLSDDRLFGNLPNCLLASNASSKIICVATAVLFLLISYLCDKHKIICTLSSFFFKCDTNPYKTRNRLTLPNSQRPIFHTGCLFHVAGLSGIVSRHSFPQNKS